MTQRQKILNEITTRPGVTNWELAQLALNYTMRISELRKDGYLIEAKRQFSAGKPSGTYKYYLIPPPTPLTDAVAPQAVSWLND